MMSIAKEMNQKDANKKNHKLRWNPKIMLALMPFWDPLIPPNGIAAIKGHLVKQGFNVKARDVSIEREFQELYDQYFDLLRQNIDESHLGNLFNMGHDLLTDHLTAHVHQSDDEGRYIELVREIIYLVFYVKLDDTLIREFNGILTTLFSRLEAYWVRLLEEEKPDVLGLTAYRGILPTLMFAFKLTKERFPHILTVLGGSMFSDSHAVGSPNYESFMKETEPYIDKVIIGSGELIFEKLLKGELPEEQRIFSKEDIGNRTLEYHEMEIQDFFDFDMARYPFVPVSGSKSCPFACTFCNSKSYWGKYTRKDPKQLVREMQELYRRHGKQLFHLTDSLVNPYIQELSDELIATDSSFYYDCYLRVGEDVASIENTMKWRRSGLYRVRLGVESGSQRVLDMMHKGITPSLAKASVSALAYAGIKTTLYMVVGHPGESEEDFQKTLQLMEELKDDIWQAEAAPIMFHYSGQGNTGAWEGTLEPLYSDNVSDMMISRPWTLVGSEPSREERHHRMFKFAQHCKSLGIGNPYSLQENYLADLRWKKLHRFSVPGLHEFNDSRRFITENLDIKITATAKDTRRIEDAGDFGF